MSKDFYQFKNETGDTAFLIGLVDCISDRLSLQCDCAYSLEADIFRVTDGDLSSLNDAVKKRICVYSEQEGNFDKEKIDLIDFKLKQIEDYNIAEYMYSKMKKYSSSDRLEEEIEEFLSALKWQLDNPIGIYEPMQLPDANIDVLGRIYMAFAWDYFFIAYEGFVVMVVIGTVE